MKNNYGFYYNPANNRILICSMDDEIVKSFEKIEIPFEEFDKKKFKERIKEFNKEQ